MDKVKIQRHNQLTQFEEAFEKGNIVVVAGASISKDMPANLSSWWEYNILLV